MLINYLTSKFTTSLKVVLMNDTYYGIIYFAFVSVKDDAKINPGGYIKMPKPTYLVLICASYGNHFTWLFADISGSLKIIADNKNLVISSKMTNSGYYLCYGSYSNETHFVALANIDVYSKNNTNENNFNS